MIIVFKIREDKILKKYIKLSIAAILVMPIVLYAGEKPNETRFVEADTLEEMFKYSALSGNLRAVYGEYNNKEVSTKDTYATAIGGNIKYELAPLNGFNAAIGFSTSHDINFANGQDDKQNADYSSSKNKYTALSESYVNYKHNNFNFRVGRQVIDTPLADSDDIRMIYNTFEAYIATYALSNFNFTAGKLQKWQGFDAGLDNGWQKTGENGTYFGGVTFTSDIIDANAWYYNITELTNAYYTDATLKYELKKDISLAVSLQYLRESELKNSATQATIYGANTEISAYGFTFNTAYNKSKKMAAKDSFSGFGGGTLFTNMDTMILNEFTADREARAIVSGISYQVNDFKLSYAYGDFKGKADSLGDKAHVIEYDFGVEYNFVENGITLKTIYVVSQDKENSIKTDVDWNRFEIMASYSF